MNQYIQETVHTDFADQVYYNTQMPTQVNTNQRESDTSQHESNTNQRELTRVNTSPTRVNTNQHESDNSQYQSVRPRNHHNLL